MSDHVIFWLSGFGIGLWAGVMAMSAARDRDPDWRRSISHENTNRPSGPPPLKLRRSGDPGAILPTTQKPDIIPKPQPPPVRIIDVSGRTIGYQPLPWVQGSSQPTTPQPMTTHSDNIDYLGDGVYAHFDGYSIGLSVNDHRNELAVWLEPQVLAALNCFAERMTQQEQADG